ncbi:MAG: sporulation protein [Marinobacterium sp.]|nr:sporulation protein [Marinobacterium sp.]
MFKKILASVGIGGAKVDTLVNTTEVQPGGKLPIEVVIMGGDVDQSISGINLALMTRIKFETEDGEGHRNHTLQRWQLDQVFEVEAGDRRVIPMELDIHPEVPLTALDCHYNQSRVWLQTGLEIDMALDADDVDPLLVVPTPTMAAIIQAAHNCGLHMFKADVEQGTVNAPNFSSSLGCYQELEFRPHNGFTTLNEVELTMVPREGGVHLLIEVDRMLRSDSYQALSFPDHTPVDAIEAQLRAALGL